MEAIETISLILGVGWASGINLYAAVLVLGWMGATGEANLPPELQVLSSPGVMAAAGIMYSIEFFADKIPGVDTSWDVLHTFIRIPAGAFLASSAAQGLDIGASAELIGLLVGGGLAATSHTTKMGTRALINTSPEPFSNWTASFAEDFAVIGGVWASLVHPEIFILMVVVFIGLAIWLLPKMWRVLKRIANKIGSWFGNKKSEPETENNPQAGFEATKGSVSETQPDLLQNMYSDAAKNKPE